jgi:hypothetical protein
MIDAYVRIDLPDQLHAPRGRLLAEIPAEGALPLLQIYDCFEYLLALKRHRNGGVEHERIWVSDDRFDGRCLPVNPLPEDEIRGQLRRFFGDDPRAPVMVRESPLR